MRAETEVEEQPISDQKTRLRAGVQVAQHARRTTQNGRQEDCGAMTRCQQHTRGKKRHAPMVQLWLGPITQHWGVGVLLGFALRYPQRRMRLAQAYVSE